MGKASSAKKVAKVARSSGGPVREQTKLGFPLAVFVICVLGTLLVVWARADRNSAVAVPPQLTDHWHEAYGIYVCDAFLPSLTDVGPDTTGIHTHDDGIVHVHPFSNAATGERATWSTFGEVVGLSFDGSSFTMPDGTTYSDGFDCNGEPATVSIWKWPADDPEAEPVVFTDDLGDVRFDTDRGAYTIAVVPEGTDVPRPESIPTLDNLSDVEPTGTPNDPSDPALSPDATVGGEPSDTATVEGEAPADEAPAGDDTATTTTTTAP